MSSLLVGETKNKIYNLIKELELSVLEKEKSHLGIPLFVSFKRGRKIGKKKENNNIDAFVEFIHPNSANRMIKIASTQGIVINSKRLRVFKAGTKPEILFVKPKKND